MKYRTRQGVILSNICDEYFLVSGKDAREHCPYVTHLNETACFIWKKLESGMMVEEILKSVYDEFEGVEMNEIREIVDAFISQLKDAGYIIEESEE